MEKYEDTQGMNRPAGPTDADKPQDSRPERTIVDLYDHGFTNGLLKVDTQNFEKFLEADERKKLAALRLNQVRDDIKQQRAAIQTARDKQNGLETVVIQHQQNELELQRQVEQLHGQQGKIETRITTGTEERKAIQPYYNWLVTILFLIAGFGFLAADILLTRDVLFNSINLPDIEALILAIAVASLAFVIKPAIDRIFEEPYHKEGRRKRNHALLIVVSLLILISLGLFGNYRNYAQYNNKEQNEWKKKTKPFYAKIDNDGDTLTQAETIHLDSLQNEIFQLNTALYQDNRIITAFTLLSILFALAGAICFSIGFPSLSMLLRKTVLLAGTGINSLQLARLNRQVKVIFGHIKTARTAAAIAERQKAQLPDIESLEVQLGGLLQTELSLLEEWSKQQQEADKAWYREGALRGNRYEVSDKLIFTPLQVDRVTRHGKATGNGTRNGQAASRLNRERPGRRSRDFLHEQIRDMIDYNFNKNQFTNGSHENE